MQLTGILRTWHDDRGYGFIAPTHGGAELFVHVSAFPRDGSRPVEGESLTYELGRGQNGKPQAVRVVRLAIGVMPARRAAVETVGRTAAASPRRGNRTWLRSGLLASLALACVAYAYHRYARVEPARTLPAAAQPERARAAAPATAHEAATAAAPYRCDGRTMCQQMTSCAEATYFLNNCPGTKMDGNHDGVPCEQQWCRK
jgi:cold shock CspA family protein